MARQDESLFTAGGGRAAGVPVECLGVTFADDHARRAHFTELLREKLKDPDYRSIEGFPIANDEDIIALSDPPYFTTCPNPWLSDLVAQHGKAYDSAADDYEREPFAADVSEGKNDPVYSAHSYHTKVPHKAIMRYILHYTDPGDVVLDGFCGTGMTGVAAQLCGDRRAVENLGYLVEADGTILDETGAAFSRLGPRFAVLNDLSPAATFIAYNYNSPIDVRDFEHEAERILDRVESENGWMYLTLQSPTEQQLREAVGLLAASHEDLKQRAPHLPWAKISWAAWSDVLVCPHCSGEVVFWDVAVDKPNQVVKDVFPCPGCGGEMTKQSAERAWETTFDTALGHTRRGAKRKIVYLSCTRAGSRRFEKRADDFDIRLAQVCSSLALNGPCPPYPIGDGDEIGRLGSLGIELTSDLWPPRALLTLAKLKALSTHPRFLFALTGASQNLSWLYRWRANGKGGTTSGTYYICATPQENNAVDQLARKCRDAARAAMPIRSVVSTGPAQRIDLPDESVGYIFTDPPFGSNLMYSELNLLFESWLRVLTNATEEAVQSRTQRKGLAEYQDLMTQCFREYFRVLRRGGWATIEFHNSKNSVWMAIQEALQVAGFVVADVRTLDKQQGSFKQVNLAGAVKQDLVISAYKPRAGVETELRIQAGSPDAAWTFVRGHLRQLPVVVTQGSTVEVVVERQAYLLYDRMVGFHVQRGLRVPLSAAEFYAGLDQRFPSRDGMFFLPEQVAEYDGKRLQAAEIRQLELFVTDEDSAIQWLRRLLSDRPLSFQELHPLFMREIAGWERHEKPLELAELLEENFIRYGGDVDVPSQIHAYLSSNFHELRGRDKSDPTLRAKAKDRWYVPDPRKAGDLEQLRERTLLKEFDDYAAGKGKLRVFRVEAVRAGFKRAWQEHDYETIISVAERLPADVLQEDAKLLMWYDQALTRAGE